MSGAWASDDPGYAEFVVGHHAIEQRADAEEDGDSRFGAAPCEAKQPGGGDEQEAHRVIHHAVNTGWYKAHVFFVIDLLVGDARRLLGAR